MWIHRKAQILTLQPGKRSVVYEEVLIAKSAKSPQKQKNGVPYVKAKSFYFNQVCKLELQRIGITIEPQAQLE